MEPGLVWSSLEWRDGTRYQGLTRDGKMHSHGVLTFANKDRYEGEFEDGLMHGAGVYVWSSGMVHRGDWLRGAMHGCGSRIWKAPGGELQVAEGRFWGDEFVGDVTPCSQADGSDAAVEADVAAFQARSFLLQGRQQQQQQGRQQQSATDRRQQQQTRPGGLWGWFGGGSRSSSSSSSGSSGNGAPTDDPRLQGVLQRLMADRVAEAHRQQSGKVS